MIMRYVKSSIKACVRAVLRPHRVSLLKMFTTAVIFVVLFHLFTRSELLQGVPFLVRHHNGGVHNKNVQFINLRLIEIRDNSSTTLLTQRQDNVKTENYTNFQLSSLLSETSTTKLDKNESCTSRMNINLPKEVEIFLSKPVINPHSFSYIHNQHHVVCKNYGKGLDFLFVVPSAPDNVKRRQKVRSSNFVQYTKVTSHNSRYVFFIGKPDDSNTTRPKQKMIDEEMASFGDIVQEDFIDIYKHIRLKAVSMLKWACTFCCNAKYVIRLDDDVRVKLSNILRAVRQIGSKHDNFVVGRIRIGERPTRKKKDKYYLSEAEYPYPVYPPYSRGGLLGYPMKTVSLLYEASLRQPAIWLDDIYITGICSQKVNASLIWDNLFRFKH